MNEPIFLFQIAEPTLIIETRSDITQRISPGDDVTLSLVVRNTASSITSAYEVKLTISASPDLLISLNSDVVSDRFIRAGSNSVTLSIAELAANDTLIVRVNVAVTKDVIFRATYSLSQELVWRSTPPQLPGRDYAVAAEQNVSVTHCVRTLLVLYQYYAYGYTVIGLILIFDKPFL